MPTFEMQGTVKRVVIDTVSMTVDAKTLAEAYVKAEDVLTKFPEPHDVDGVTYCYIEDRASEEMPQIYDISEKNGVDVA